MKALMCEGAESYQVREVPVPRAGEGEVLVKVLYAGICGSDMAIIHGRNPFARYPLIPGHEFCGEVVESQYPDFQPGQRVAVMPVVGCGGCPSCRAGDVNRCSQVWLYGVHRDGGFAEFVKVHTTNIFPVNQTVDPRRVAFTEPLAVGVHCNRAGEVKAGYSVAILGGGIIGLVILQVAKIRGAGPVLVSDIIPERVERAKVMGADWAVDSRGVNLVEFSRKEVVPGGFDVVYDVVGSEVTLETGLELLKPGGMLVMVAVPEVEKKILNVKKIFAQEKKFTASRTYSMADYQVALDYIIQGKVEPLNMITSIFPLDSIRTAFEKVEHGKDQELKVLIDIGVGGASQ
ncbi:MAG: alcohol dehydrogenase catalytic domain-containing protein [Candidatus Atribacteria bacterium]|nr:alcohol dehydrogenase catalytic domain-containing protein [Candidatus Atribacteria bacterium]